MTTADWIAPPGGDSWWAVGLEGGVSSGTMGLVGRAGFALGRPHSDRATMSWGGGIVVRGLRVDYAFQGWGVTGAESHRFGLRWIP